MQEKNAFAEQLDGDIQQRVAQFKQEQSNGQGFGYKSIPFPLEFYPRELQDFLINANHRLGLNLDVMAAGILFTFSVASGNSIRFNTPVWDNVRPILYMVTVAPKGSGKSHALKYVTDPLEQMTSAFHEEWKRELVEYDTMETPMGARPKRMTVMTNKMTMEAIVPELNKNPKGIGIYRDEWNAWLQSMNKYNRGDSDLSDYIALFDGTSVDVTTKTSDPLRADDAFVSISGGIQPGIAKTVLNERMYESGFIDRLLFELPTGINAVSKYTKGRVGDNDHVQFCSIIKEFYANTPVGLDPIYLKDDNAEDCYLEHLNSYDGEIKSMEADSPLRGVLAKMQTYFPRFVLLSHVIEAAFTGGNPTANIDQKHVENAIILVEYYRKNNTQVVKSILNRSPFERLPSNKVRFYNQLPELFDTKLALELAPVNDIQRTAAFDFLNNRKFFEKEKHGIYRKVYS